jgi:hypothetical protein
MPKHNTNQSTQPTLPSEPEAREERRLPVNEWEKQGRRCDMNRTINVKVVKLENGSSELQISFLPPTLHLRKLSWR